MTSIGLLILRLGFGTYLAIHGWGKLQQAIDGNFEFADPFGVGGRTSLFLAIFGEFVCPILVMIGFGTRLTSIPPTITMAVAAFMIHRSDPWTAGEGYRLYMTKEAQSWASKEPALLFFLAFTTLIFTGAGKLSLDSLLWKRWRAPRSVPPPA